LINVEIADCRIPEILTEKLALRLL